MYFRIIRRNFHKNRITMLPKWIASSDLNTSVAYYSRPQKLFPISDRNLFCARSIDRINPIRFIKIGFEIHLVAFSSGMTEILFLTQNICAKVLCLRIYLGYSRNILKFYKLDLFIEWTQGRKVSKFSVLMYEWMQ